MNISPFSVTFDLALADQACSLQGFSGVEPIGRWSDGNAAKIILQNDAGWPENITLEIEATPFVAPDFMEQNVTISVNDGQIMHFKFNRHFHPEHLKIPVSLDRDATGKQLKIALTIDKPGQPSRHGMGNDNRLLGLLIKSITVSARKAELQHGKPNPYKGLPANQFWRQSISVVEAHLVDPVTHTRFKISPDARVGTAGSCFAQHISRRIMEAGFNYYVTENGDHLCEQERSADNYGTFSARYGNIYTTVQLLQLFEEAFGKRTPAERAWLRPDGLFVDPYRQQIQPGGFASQEEVIADRQKHLQAVRQLFLETDIFVFTLGLTEAWRSKDDGSIFSAAPGVIGGVWDEERYEFVNLTIEETYSALEKFLIHFHTINPSAKVLLTVSPVPLIATYERHSVLVSTVYSKSVLRIAAEKALMAFDWVDYFASFEIITGSFSGGLYFEQDHREVNAIGVSHAMRCFLEHYIEGKSASMSDTAQLAVQSASVGGIVCDEEIINSVRD